MHHKQSFFWCGNHMVFPWGRNFHPFEKRLKKDASFTYKSHGFCSFLLKSFLKVTFESTRSCGNKNHKKLVSFHPVKFWMHQHFFGWSDNTSKSTIKVPRKVISGGPFIHQNIASKWLRFNVICQVLNQLWAPNGQGIQSSPVHLSEKDMSSAGTGTLVLFFSDQGNDSGQSFSSVWFFSWFPATSQSPPWKNLTKHKHESPFTPSRTLRWKNKQTPKNTSLPRWQNTTHKTTFQETSPRWWYQHLKKLWSTSSSPAPKHLYHIYIYTSYTPPSSKECYLNRKGGCIGTPYRTFSNPWSDLWNLDLPLFWLGETQRNTMHRASEMGETKRPQGCKLRVVTSISAYYKSKDHCQDDSNRF